MNKEDTYSDSGRKTGCGYAELLTVLEDDINFTKGVDSTSTFLNKNKSWVGKRLAYKDLDRGYPMTIDHPIGRATSANIAKAKRKKTKSTSVHQKLLL